MRDAKPPNGGLGSYPKRVPFARLSPHQAVSHTRLLAFRHVTAVARHSIVRHETRLYRCGGALETTDTQANDKRLGRILN